MVLIRVNLLFTNPFTRNHLLFVYGSKIMLGIAGLFFTIPSIKKCFFLLQHILTGPGFLWVIPAFFRLFNPTGTISVSFIMPEAGHLSCLVSLTPSDYFIHQESSPYPLWCISQGHYNNGCGWPHTTYQESFLSLHAMINRVRVLFDDPLLHLQGKFSLSPSSR